MSNRILNAFALLAASAALAIGGLGATAAGADGLNRDAGHHCKGANGKKKHNCKAHRHNGMNAY